MIAENLKYLRRKHHLSQQAFSDTLEIPRTTLGDYERGKTEPNIEMLVRIADHFNIKVDDLVRSNLSHRDLEILRNKELRVLAISVDAENRENIELVDTKAEAGYLESFQDPEYIKELPKLYFPSIPQGTYRAFEIRGDSMLPMEAGSIVICSYTESLREVKDGRTYVVVSKQDGVVYKRVRVQKEHQQLTLSSDNEVYAPYTIDFADIDELWQYYAHLSFSDHRQMVDQMVESRLIDIQKKVTKIAEKLNTE
ncbi:MAG: LexA family transcriptional regulator [Saprospiraceae bacterium]|nr:LexA family transcriptional regulator [Saprospiraceae bacterium]HPG09548.1 LexA family transcriptional regulator [Saprospiraceae bacterium]HPR00826.1 LexA family transcriptional regulator [Saprospiraceae bacterium]HQU52265.1 LexA family transcriptional regulator [Saprospiraceae bacterium]